MAMLRSVYSITCMVKAVFFDIDGTLVSFNTHKIPQSTLNAIGLLRDKGIKVFIATGRSWRQMQELKDFPAFDGYITLNGSCCITDAHEIIYSNCIPEEDLSRLAEFHKNTQFPIEFVYAEHETMTECTPTVAAAWARVDMPVPPIVPIQECSTEGVYQLGIFLNREKEAEYDITRNIMPNCESMRWSPDFFDIIPKGSRKSLGIDKIIAHYGIHLEETMAFGDGGNDIDMITHAGIGVAMGNAGDEVKAAADHATTSVDEDGIFNALAHFGII